MKDTNSTTRWQQLKPGDERLLSELATAAFHAAYAGTHSRENRELYCQENYHETALSTLLDNTETCIKALKIKEKEAGYFILRKAPCPYLDSEKTAELKHIYLLKEAYGMGHGSLLFREACAEARTWGMTHLWLCVSNRNERAQAFYQKAGFKKLGQGPDLLVGSDHLSSSILCISL